MSFQRIAILLTFLGFASSAWAAQVYVEPASGSGVGPSDLTTTTELIRNAVPDVSSDTVTDQSPQADWILRPHLIRLGDAYILSLTKLKGDQVVYSSQLKAAHIEELDKVATRLTRSVLKGERAAEHPRVGEVTDQEATDGTQRRAARSVGYLGFGGAEMSNLGTSGLGFSVGAAYGWDVNTAILKIVSEGDFQGNAFFVSAGLGGNYYLSSTDVAPYLSADFGGGAAKIKENEFFSGQVVGGFVVGVGAGVDLLRTSAVNLDIGFRAGFLLHTNEFGTPAVYALKLGLIF